MLVIRRKKGEKIIIAGTIIIDILEVEDGRAKLGITAPLEIDIVREELLRRQAPHPVTKPERGACSPLNGKAVFEESEENM